MSKDLPKEHISNTTEEGIFHSCCGMPATGPHLEGCSRILGACPMYPVTPYRVLRGEAEDEVPEGEIRVQQLTSVQWKNSCLVFGLSTDGKVYRQTRKGWLPVSMKIRTQPEDDRPAEDEF